LAVAGASLGIVPINRHPNAAALAQIADPSGFVLLSAIASFDLLGVVSGRIEGRRQGLTRREIFPAASVVESAADFSPLLEDFPTPTLAPAFSSGNVAPPRQAFIHAQRALEPDGAALVDFLRFIEVLNWPEPAKQTVLDSPLVSDLSEQLPPETVLDWDEFPTPEWGFEPDAAPSDPKRRMTLLSSENTFWKPQDNGSPATSNERLVIRSE
jgi:hypothetical protein